MDARLKNPGEPLKHSGGESHLLREIVRTHQVLMATFSREVGIPSARLGLMRLLAVEGPDLGVMDLARKLGVNAAAVTRQVHDLERDGLVERTADARDGRRSHITLTRKGAVLFSEFHDRSHELEAELAGLFNPDDLATAVSTLARLRGFLEGGQFRRR